MIQCLDLDSRLPAPREGTQLDRGFRIKREPQDRFIERSGLMHTLQLLEDGVGFGEFFFGRLFLTARRW